MKIPGFGAELSVYETKIHYRGSAMWSEPGDLSSVPAQLPSVLAAITRFSCGPCIHGIKCCVTARGVHCFQCACPVGLTLCDQRCTSLSGDPYNCGRCGQVCGSGQICQNGVCIPFCTQPTPDPCNGMCTSLLDDPNNCGSCGFACPPGNFCDGGKCYPIT